MVVKLCARYAATFINRSRHASSEFRVAKKWGEGARVRKKRLLHCFDYLGSRMFPRLPREKNRKIIWWPKETHPCFEVNIHFLTMQCFCIHGTLPRSDSNHQTQVSLPKANPINRVVNQLIISKITDRSAIYLSVQVACRIPCTFLELYRAQKSRNFYFAQNSSGIIPFPIVCRIDTCKWNSLEFFLKN